MKKVLPLIATIVFLCFSILNVFASPGNEIKDNCTSINFNAVAAPITPTENILYVNKTATGNGSGDSWTNALPELAGALKWAKQNKPLGLPV